MKKHFTRKITALALILLLVAAMFPAQVFAAGKRGEELTLYTLTEEDGGFGVSLVDENGEPMPVSAPAKRGGPSRAPAAELPAQYDAREDDLVTSVKYQSGAGICWAFSTISAIETSAVKQELADVGCVDFSESHLANFAMNSLTADDNDPTSGDGESADAGQIFSTGANYFKAAAALARGSGAANEADYPFDPADYAVLLPESDRYVSAMHISDSSVIDYEGEELSELLPAVKQAILDCGSVTAAYHTENSAYNITTIDGVRTSSYFENATTETNHMVTIVGWDDGYSVEHFGAGNRPALPGAWLCKNSWSTQNANLVDGYFYLSYYESSLKEFNAITASPVSALDDIYQYDGVGYKFVWTYTNTYSENGAPKIANVFTASKRSFLSSVGFWTVAPNTKYILYVYTDLTDPDDPTSGTLVKKIMGAAPYAGYHTEPIGEIVSLDEGEKFSVCAYMHNGEKGVMLTEGLDYLGYGSCAGQTYCNDGNGNWADTYSTPQVYNDVEYYTHNTPLKAMTVNSMEHEHIAGETVCENAVAGTCVAPGSRDEVTYCTVCGEELSRTTVETAIDPDNHVNTRTVGETASTCVEHGYTAGVYCDDCRQYVSGHAEKPYAEHTWSRGSIILEPTCHSTGTMYFTCTVGGCDASKTEPIDINYENHDGETRTERENETAGTCSVPGSCDEVVYCLGCGREKSRTTVETSTDPTNHVNTHEEAETASSCYRPGYTAGVYCDDCRQYISGHEEKPLIAHTWDDGVVKTKPTCVSEGVMEYRCTVKSCGAVRTEPIAIDPDAHMHTHTENAKSATCAETGYTGDVWCDDCEQFVSSGTQIEKNNVHVGGTEVRGAKEPTCAKNGYTGDTYCLGCGRIINAGKAIARTNNHNFTTAEIVSPGCETRGYTVYVCTVCGEEKKDNYTDALGHWDHNDDGFCDNCGTSMTSETPQQGSVCKYCGQVHNGLFGKIIQMFHSILYFFKNIGK